MPNTYAFTSFIYNNNVISRSILGTSDRHSCQSSQALVQLSKGDQVWVNVTNVSPGIYMNYDAAVPYFAGTLINTRL